MLDSLTPGEVYRPLKGKNHMKIRRVFKERKLLSAKQAARVISGWAGGEEWFIRVVRKDVLEPSGRDKVEWLPQQWFMETHQEERTLARRYLYNAHRNGDIVR